MERWWHPEGSNLTDPAVQARASRDANNANRALALVTTSGSDTLISSVKPWLAILLLHLATDVLNRACRAHTRQEHPKA